MEQVIKAQEVEQEIRNRVEEAFRIQILSGESVRDMRTLWEEVFPKIPEKFLDNYFGQKERGNIGFVVKNDEIQSMLQLVPYAAAMRRNPPLPGANRLPCMADVVRVDTNLISVAATKETYRGRGYMKRLMQGALEYQRRKKIPFCFVRAEQGAFFARFGFQEIDARPQYELNKEIISAEMLKRADAGEIIHLNPSSITLSAADRSSLLSLAHFVNAALCKRYGLFNIRSAVYYERFLGELISCGGNLYQLMENGKRIGYFAYIHDAQDCVREAVFERESDLERYFYVIKESKPFAMARVVNLPEMLKHVSANGKVTIAIRLKDPVIAENDGLFIWYLDEKGSRMERVEDRYSDEEASMRPEVTATIGEFTAFIFKHITLKQNMKFDSIYLSGPAWINERY